MAYCNTNYMLLERGATYHHENGILWWETPYVCLFVYKKAPQWILSVNTCMLCSAIFSLGLKSIQMKASYISKLFILEPNIIHFNKTAALIL